MDRFIAASHTNLRPDRSIPPEASMSQDSEVPELLNRDVAMYSSSNLRPFTAKLCDINRALPYNSTNGTQVASRLQRSPTPCGTCPIDRLPTEILTHIFSCLLSDEGLDEYWRSSRRAWEILYHSNRGIAAVMFVCRFWRDVVVHCSLLWSRVTIDGRTHPSCPVPHLKRSRAIPIKVYVFNCNLDIIRLLAPHSSRMRELHIHFDDDVGSSVLDGLSLPAPILRDLSLSMGDTGGRVSKILPRVFDGHTPQLKKLFLGPFGFTHNRFINLTHLRLANQMDIDWSMSDFLDMLEASPDLEELDLQASSPEPVEGLERRVVLKKLRIFYLCYHAWDQLVSIFSHVCIPKEAALIVHDVLEDAGKNVASIFPADVSHIENLGRVTKVSVSSEHRYFDMLGHSEDGRSSFRYGSAIDEPSFDSSSWQTFGRFLNLANVTEIWVDCMCAGAGGCNYRKEDSAAALSQWVVVLQQMPALQQICVSGPGSHPIIQALSSEPPADEGVTLFAPKLHTLIVYNDPNVSPPLLTALAQTRRAYGIPLRHLHVLMPHPDVPSPWRDTLLSLMSLQGELVLHVCVEFEVHDDDRPRISVPVQWDDEDEDSSYAHEFRYHPPEGDYSSCSQNDVGERALVHLGGEIF